jgi:hypothetical protein
MHSHHKYIILISLFILTAGMPIFSYGLDDEGHGHNGGEHQAQQTNPGHRPGAGDQHHQPEGSGAHVQRQRDVQDGEHHERQQHRDRNRGGDRGGDFGPGFFGGTPFGYVPDYGNSYNSPDNANANYQNSAGPYDVGYRDGFDAGQYDHLNGSMYNPRQYERGGNPDYFEGFVAGYRDGWNH